MNIVLSTFNFYPSHKGGTEVYTKGLAVFLKNSGHKVLIIAALDFPDAVKGVTLWNKEDIKVVRYYYEGIDVIAVHIKYQTADEIYANEKKSLTDAFVQILPMIGWSNPEHLIMNGLSTVSGISLLNVIYILNCAAKVSIVVHTPFICPKADMIYYKGHSRCGVCISDKTCATCMISSQVNASPPVGVLLAGIISLLGSSNLFSATPFRLKEYIRKKIAGFDLLDKRTIAWVVFSNDMLSFLKQQKFISSDKIFLIRHGINKQVFFRNDKERLPFLPFRFLYAGRFEKIKGVQLLSDAWKRLEDNPEARQLTFAGNWNESPVGKEIFAELSERKDVLFMPSMDQRALADIYRASHCVIIPSEWIETGPLVFHEAVACGCDIITSDIGGQGELAAVYRDNAFSFRSGNATSLYKMIYDYSPAGKASPYLPMSEQEHFTALTEKIF
jgi:glycosyltransferase involved in cell wall biosynthesis